jgi:hypothetical protein
VTVLRVCRAHSYQAVEKVEAELLRLPTHWRQDVAHIPWIILPDDLSPLWIGLMDQEFDTGDGRLYSQIGGWYQFTDGHPNWKFAPHIYLSHGSAWAAVHEVGHALSEAWHTSLDDLFRPNAALYDYMASNADEYFACAIDAYLRPAGQPGPWGEDNHDLAVADPNIFAYLTHKLEVRQ